MGRGTFTNTCGSCRFLSSTLSRGLHVDINEAGAAAAAGARAQLARLREERGDKPSVTIVRRELRGWLVTSPEGRAVETAVGKLLAEKAMAS